MIGYAVGSVAVIEAADLVVPRLGVSDSVITILLVLALVGFPIALVLAWFYDLTPDGVVRFDPASAPEQAGVRVPYPAAVLSLLVVAGVGWWLGSGRSDGHDASTVMSPGSSNSLAVLPFRDMSPSGDQRWLGEGLAEEILGGLARVPNLLVVARQSSFAMESATVAEIADRLGVTHVLSGSVRTEGNRARIRAQLTEVASERGLWSRDFQPELTSVLDAQEEIARAVVDALEVELGAVGTAGIMSASTSDPVAHENYLRALRLWNRRSESDILSAIDHLGRAVGRDPDYAAAWAGLAYAYLVLPEYSPTVDLQTTRAEATTAATRALEIDPDQPDALTAMGWVRMIHNYDWAAAERLIARALSLDQANVNALHWQSHVMSWSGRHESALSLARRATELDPLSAIMRQNLAFILMEAGEYEEALRQVDAALQSDPGFGPSLQAIWNINTRVGRHAEAASALQRWLVRIGRDAAAAAELAREFGAARSAWVEEGRPQTLPRDLMDRLRPGLEVAGQLYASVGDSQTTLELLERGYRERAGSRSLLSMEINPLYDFLRDDPTFRDLLNRVGLGSGANRDP
jgi:TolB-like protein/Tfp pilus assembly protein PilF